MSIDYKISRRGLRIDTFPKVVLDIKVTADYSNMIKNDERIKQGAIEVVGFKISDEFFYIMICSSL